jgi:hypothetical protein
LIPLSEYLPSGLQGWSVPYIKTLFPVAENESPNKYKLK